ncbi:MAG: hypothetical protein FMNOHCHN_02585 [Ignavibacteriaceae bacterium]|nr:hypothetical protein [Ignavibacteriaceae bacterium]
MSAVLFGMRGGWLDYLLPSSIVLVNILAAYRQKAEKYGHLFILYTIGELIAPIFLFGFGIRGNYWYILLRVPIIYFLLIEERERKHYYWIGVLMLALYFITPPDLRLQLIIVVIMHSLITILILKDSFIDLLKTGAVNLFYMVFVFAEINSITRIIVGITAIPIFKEYFLISGWTNVLLYLYFCYYRPGEPKLTLRVTREEDLRH